ncbi:MAG: Na+/H+ antiporter subunit E [Pseudomonadota bacterium]
MNLFSVNILLAAGWGALTGSLTLFSLTSGFILGFGILWVLQPLVGGTSGYFLKVFYWLKLIVLFHYELIVSSIEVVWDVVTPKHRARPGIIEMPLDVQSDFGILLVTNLISLTPGTLSLDVSEDRKTLTIHAMFADDPDELCHQLKSGMERWVRDAVED